MQAIRDALTSCGIAHPAEFFVGIGVCILVPLVAVSILFRALFMKTGEMDEGPGWRYAILGVVGCGSCTAGLLAAAVVPVFWPPDEVPDAGIAVMCVGDVIALAGLMVLLASTVLDVRALRRPRTRGEVSWARAFISYAPISIFLTGVVAAYELADVH
jgi:hypothetical protein